MSETTKAVVRRNVLKASLAVAAAPAVISSARAEAKVTWKVQSHWPKASGSFNDSLGALAKKLEERTGGRFKLEMYGAGEIAKDREIYNIVRRGAVPMGTISPGYILGEAQAMGLYYGTPGTLRESWEMMHLTKNLGIEKMVNDELKPKGVVIMGDKSYPTELVLKKKVTSLEEFSSLKVRSTGTMLQYLAAAGASPQQVAGPEIYQAISTGVVDGAHWGAAIGALSMKFWEVAKYHMKPALGFANDAYIVNVAALEKLPPDLRLQFTSLVEERYFLRSVEYLHQEAQALTTGKAKMGVEVIRFPDEVLKKFADASQAILKKEEAKGDIAAKGVKALTGLMSDLGYV
jgi:TRAP-type mannitol/chloroaromatic compound transport system substrate-binding protein